MLYASDNYTDFQLMAYLKTGMICAIYLVHGRWTDISLICAVVSTAHVPGSEPHSLHHTPIRTCLRGRIGTVQILHSISKQQVRIYLLRYALSVHDLSVDDQSVDGLPDLCNTPIPLWTET